MPSTLRFVDPSTGTELLSLSAFTNSAGRLTALDLGFPAVRSASTPISGAHGETDTTRWVGARAVTANVTLPAGPAADPAVDTLAGLCDPSRRMFAYLRRDGWTGERRVLVRGAAFTCPPGVMRQAQLGFVAPAGLLEDSAAIQVVLSPSGQVAGGRSYGRSYPYAYDPGLVPGAANLKVGGTSPAPAVIDIYGPCSDPAVVCVTTGARIAFTGLTLAAGDFLRVDMGARTALLNNDPAQSRYNRFDFTRSSWWLLPVGPVQVAFSPSTPGVGCQAVLSYRARWL